MGLDFEQNIIKKKEEEEKLKLHTLSSDTQKLKLKDLFIISLKLGKTVFYEFLLFILSANTLVKHFL